ALRSFAGQFLSQCDSAFKVRLIHIAEPVYPRIRLFRIFLDVVSSTSADSNNGHIDTIVGAPGARGRERRNSGRLQKSSPCTVHDLTVALMERPARSVLTDVPHRAGSCSTPSHKRRWSPRSVPYSDSDRIAGNYCC